MSNLKLSWTLLMRGVAVSALAMVFWTGRAWAQTNSVDYTFLVGAGFVCDTADSSACPAVVKSADGAAYELSGAGTLTPPRKLVTAAGTYSRKSASGDLMETGVWVASELVSFDPYGIAPGALMREGRAVGPTQFGPRRFPMFPGSTPSGGLAVLRIRLLPVLGSARNATLQVNCAIGRVPSERAVEGIRLAFEGGGAEFDEEISGRAMFLLNRFGAGAAATAPTPDVDTKPAPTEVQR